MPMIALSPVGVSWQKTTCSWSASPAEPLPLWDVANTLVTVATLLIRPGSSLNRDRIKRIAPGGRSPDGRLLGWEPAAFPYLSVTHSIDDLVTLSTVFAAFWYVTIRQ